MKFVCFTQLGPPFWLLAPFTPGSGALVFVARSKQQAMVVLYSVPDCIPVHPCCSHSGCRILANARRWKGDNVIKYFSMDRSIDVVACRTCITHLISCNMARQVDSGGAPPATLRRFMSGCGRPAAVRRSK